MQISGKPWHKLTDSVLFLLVTLVFIIIFAFTFKGFNGTDDLQYSLLSARISQNNFSPFVPTDIFSGRVGLLYLQSLFYRLAGVNVLSTLVPTLLVTITCAWLCCFRLMDKPGPAKIITAATLFYFTPTLTGAVTGIMPDIYVTLILVVIFCAWKKCSVADNTGRWMMTGIIAGVVSGLALLFKESAVLYLPLFVLLSLNKKTARRFFIPFFLSAAGLVMVLTALYYQHATGDFFFRITQIRNTGLIDSRRPAGCNGVLDLTRLLVRLSYGPWYNFLLQGYFTLLVPAILLLSRLFSKAGRRVSLSPVESAFALHLLLILYFPANFQQYQPVCGDPRQFLMLLPFGTIIMTEAAENVFSRGKKAALLPGITVILTLAVIFLSPNKWKWLTYGLLSAGLLLPWFWRRQRIEIYAVCFGVLLAITGLEKLFFLNDRWFADLQKLHQRIGAAAVWFPEHDNLMNWNLLNGFDSRKLWNLEPYPPPALSLYYSPPGKFEPGWFIVNRSYTLRSATFFNAMDALDRSRFFTRKIVARGVSAYRIDRPAQLDSLRQLLRSGE